jgi:hypothetical protein
MTRSEMTEAVGVIDIILIALLATLEGKINRSFMEARRQIGVVHANAEDLLADGTIGNPLIQCFELCRDAGATRVAMDGVRRSLISYRLRFLPGVSLALTGIIFSLIEQARILIEMTFTSREDIDAMIITMNNAFEPSEEYAATYTDNPSVYQTLISLHSSVTAHLTERARPLPRLIRYDFPSRMPSLKLAMRIYGDARRADQLRRENKTVHPAFCQSSGRCLSA